VSGLPAGLRLAIQSLASARTGLKDSAGRMSAHYRERGASRQVIGGETDAIAYALSRMPATYAAAATVMAELVALAPDFGPASLLDVGAGPGTAAWAVAEAFPGIAATLIDHNPAFLDLARSLGSETAAGAVLVERGELTSLKLANSYDLVTCAYALTELDDATMASAAEQLWKATDGALVIIEPGRPRDYERLMAVRARLVALGGNVIAPCPHNRACPLQPPDWCHFSVRLERSRDHIRLKGASLGYEDEKFSYLVVTRPGIGKATTGRVLRQPEENKFSIALSVCDAAGVSREVIASRDKPAFKLARKLRWGDRFSPHGVD
jgi:ribosomal protein RSM22 (predicted rRNA methylase)